MFEDKLKDTLDMKITKDGDSELVPANQDRVAEEESNKAEVLRQKQTKRVLAGFLVELDSLLIEQKYKLNNQRKTMTELNFNMKTVDREI
jgi:hypothetical protein